MEKFEVPSGLVKRRSSAGKRPIQLDFMRFGDAGAHISEDPQYKKAAQNAVELHDLLLKGESPLLKDGPVVMTGWKMKSPFVDDSALDEIQSSAKKLADNIDDFWSIGIGGSYLGLRATIDAIKGSLELFNMLSREQRGNTPRIFFLGQNMDAGYTANAIRLMEGNKVGGNVISKSGGTVEPAIAFAIIKHLMENSYSSDKAARKIIAITDANKGSLRKLAAEKGYKTYSVPDDVGGRFSVTCPVGLFTLAAAGIDIKEFIAGARYAEEQTRKLPFEKNIAMQRAAMRFVAHKFMEKDIELASTGNYDLKAATWWMQQLGPESEGKNGEGLWISPQYYTEMAHANGQAVQMGKRNFIETFITIGHPNIDVTIPGKGTPVDYLDGKTMNFANQAFVDGLRDAHYEGGVPVMSYLLPDQSAYTMGMFFQTEMNAIALSGLLLGQNPFIQPGVQSYKDIANIRSGKPGTEKTFQEMLAKERSLNNKYII
jgi:glucose-6-phosphate isomerase